MKKKATCTVEFEFEWTDEDLKNPFADEYHFCELWLSNVLDECGLITKIEVECVKVEDVNNV
jgi:hypothetical protein